MLNRLQCNLLKKTDFNLVMGSFQVLKIGYNVTNIKDNKLINIPSICSLLLKTMWQMALFKALSQTYQA